LHCLPFFDIPYKFVNKEKFEDTKEVTIRSGISKNGRQCNGKKKRKSKQVI